MWRDCLTGDFNMAMPKQKPGRSKQNYRTPKNLFTAILQHLGISEFKHDFAADRFNTKAKKFWTMRDDSLVQRASLWVLACRMGWGWLNPPFGKIRPWAAKCLAVHKRGGKIALLVPASVGSNWYRDYIHEQPGVQVTFLNGRPCFDGKAGFPKDVMLVLFTGNTNPFNTNVFAPEVWSWKESASE
jgi:hypothetical protein